MKTDDISTDELQAESNWTHLIAISSADTSVVHEKLADAMLPGFPVEFDAEEAEEAGAFVEDAMSAEDAEQSHYNLGDDQTNGEEE